MSLARSSLGVLSPAKIKLLGALRKREMTWLSQYRDCATGWTTGVQFPVVAIMEFFSVCHSVQISSETHPASYPMGTLGGGGGSESKPDHSPPSSILHGVEYSLRS
jgi:hypothetical protein